MLLTPIRKGVESLRSAIHRGSDLTHNPKVLILYGRTNVGKTRTCLGCYGDRLYRMPRLQQGDLVRWDGYDPSRHTGVLFDDYAGELPLTYLNNLINPFTFQSRRMGKEGVDICPDLWIFSSQRSPSAWYPGATLTEEFLAFQRRITVARCCESLDDVLDALETFETTPHEPLPPLRLPPVFEARRAQAPASPIPTVHLGAYADYDPLLPLPDDNEEDQEEGNTITLDPRMLTDQQLLYLRSFDRMPSEFL